MLVWCGPIPWAHSRGAFAFAFVAVISVAVFVLFAAPAA
jgi:hypothetical protein